MTKHDTQRLANLTRLLDLMSEQPTDDVARELADASLMHGLIESNRLDPLVLAVIERVKDVSTEALRELQHSADDELRRRGTRDGG